MRDEHMAMSAGGSECGARRSAATWRARLSTLRTAGALAGAAAVLTALLGLPACKHSSGTDRDKGDEELRAMESYNARYAPSITLSEQVGCDVCPDLCPYVDLHLIPMPELLRGYRENAMIKYDMKHGEPSQLALLCQFDGVARNVTYEVSSAAPPQRASARIEIRNRSARGGTGEIAHRARPQQAAN